MKNDVKKINFILIAFIFFMGGFFSPIIPEGLKKTFAEDYGTTEIPVKGMVTMVDLGATACIPCKMMAPILKKVEKQYKGKAAIIFIDVWKNKEPARTFRVRAIPTQIFFNKEGKEVYRHIGFMSERAIVTQLKKMGVN